MSVLQFYMLQELAKELNGAGFPNIQDMQHRQAREFLTPDGRVTASAFEFVTMTGGAGAGDPQWASFAVFGN
jgi:hypothetical protein